MPNDAKLGLAVGVAMVIAVAVFFFRAQQDSNDPQAPQQPRNQLQLPAASARTVQRSRRALLPRPRRRPTQATLTDRKGAVQHTVQEGETLTQLAQQYYGDRSKSLTLFHVNRSRLLAPDRLPPGTVLIIPDLPRE